MAERNKDTIAEKQRAYERAYRARNKDKIAEKNRAYYERNKDKIAEKRRAYRARNKDKIAEKQQTRSGRTCSQCNEHLREPTSDGLCGFCREEALGAAA